MAGTPPSSPWALLLAAGDGTRLADLTRGADGIPVPKQFCSLYGGPSLLGLARDRARRVAAEARILTVVSARHERWWRAELGGTSPANVVVQPGNRGTAVGLLAPLLRIVARDPEARVWVLPSDHWVADEETLATSVRHALARVEREPGRVVLLGISPDSNDTQYGWIVPARPDADGFSAVTSFVEKPRLPLARRLRRRGGVWNSFLLVARARAILRLYAERLPTLLTSMSRAVEEDGLAGLYADLPALDFSKDVLQGSEESLRVLRVPSCGWSDLGTPERLQECAATFPAPPLSPRPRWPAASEPAVILMRGA